MGLTDGLVSYWRLEEASGVRVDQVGTNDLTDNASVGQAAGKIGQAAAFARASSQFLSRASNASLVMSSDFTIASWVYLTGVPAAGLEYSIVTKDSGAVAEYLFECNYSSAAFWRMVIWAGGVAKVRESSSAPVAATWTFVVGWYDSAAQTVNIQVNDGTVDSAATGAAALTTGTGTFEIGGRNGVPAAYHDGRVDETGLWNRVLTAGERTMLYNGGAGITYPFFPTQPGFVSRAALQRAANW